MNRKKGGARLVNPVEDLDSDLVQILKNHKIRYDINLVNPDMIRTINKMQPWNQWLKFEKDYIKSEIAILSPDALMESKIVDMAHLIDDLLAEIDAVKYDYKDPRQSPKRYQIASQFIKRLEKSDVHQATMLTCTKAALDVVIDYVSSRLTECLE